MVVVCNENQGVGKTANATIQIEVEMVRKIEMKMGRDGERQMRRMIKLKEDGDREIKECTVE
jgi:hypothetical protein